MACSARSADAASVSPPFNMTAPIDTVTVVTAVSLSWRRTRHRSTLPRMRSACSSASAVELPGSSSRNSSPPDARQQRALSGVVADDLGDRGKHAIGEQVSEVVADIPQ